MATLSGFFGGLAALIATIGLYGVMSYMVARRRNEIGIRMALGADRGEVVRMVMREAGLLLGAGVVVGLVAAVAAARTATHAALRVESGDPATLADGGGGARCGGDAGELSPGAARIAAGTDRGAARRVGPGRTRTGRR